jgi:hypothetical protein
MEEINCCICLEVSLTKTSCNHVLCKRCYKKAQTNPMANMQACPCCRRQDYTLVDIIITLNEEQKDAHYKALMDAYNEDHAYVRPAPRAERPARPEVRMVRPPVVHDRRAAMEGNFDAAVADNNFHMGRNIRQVLNANGWMLNEVREHNFQAMRIEMCRVWEINFDAAVGMNNYPEANNLRRALLEEGWEFNEARQVALEAAQIAYNAEREAEAARQAAREERRAARRLERRQADARARIPQALAPEMVAIPQANVMEGAIVLRTMDDYAALDQRFNPRNPARAHARVFLGEGMEIGHLPFNARPMLACVGCNKKTRRVCGACNDAHCCAACNNCANGCAPAFHHPANYQRLR